MYWIMVLFLQEEVHEVKIIIKRASNPLESVVVGGGKAFNNKKLLRALEMKEM